MKDMAKLMKQAKDMKSKMKQVQKDLKNVKIEVEKLNGAVKVVMTGEMDVVDLNIDDSLLDPSKKKNLEKVLIEAVNEASNKAKESATLKLSDVTGGLNIPGL